MDCEVVSLFLLHMAMERMLYSSINITEYNIPELSTLVTYSKLHRQDIVIRKDFGIELTMLALRRILGDTRSCKDEMYLGELMRMKMCVNESCNLEEPIWLGILFLYRTKKMACILGSVQSTL